MTFKFPTSGTTLSVPPIGTTFGVGTKVWTWDGSVFFRSDLGQRGATGATGVGVSDVKVGDDGKLSVSLDTGATLDVGDVVKPAGFKYLINVNPGTTGVALLGVQGATSNTLIFNNVDLDENDTGVFFNEIAANPKNTTLTIKSLVGATQVSLKLDGVTAVAGTNFRQITGASGSGFTSPFTIGDFVFIFKETSGKTGAGITNPTLTADGKLTFDTIDAEGATTAVVNVGEVRGATGSTGQDGGDGASAAGFDFNIVETFRYKMGSAFTPFPLADGAIHVGVGANPYTFSLTDLDGKNAQPFFADLATRFNSARPTANLPVEFMLAQESEIYTLTSIFSVNLTTSGSGAGCAIGISQGVGSVPAFNKNFRFADLGNKDAFTPGRMSLGISGSTMFVVPTIDTKRGTNIQPVLNKIPLADEMLVTTTDGVTLNDGTIGGIVRVNNRFQQFALNPFDGVTFTEGTTVFLSTIGTQGASGSDGDTGATGAPGVTGTTGSTGTTGGGITNPRIVTSGSSPGDLIVDIITGTNVVLTSPNLGVVVGASGPWGATGATGAAGTNTDPDTRPDIDIGGLVSQRDDIVNSLNTIAFGDLSLVGPVTGLKAATQSNGTLLAIRDFQNTGGAGASGSDVLIRAKQGLKLGRVDFGDGSFSDMSIRLVNGSTTDTGTVMNITPQEFDFSAGGSGALFGIHKDQGFGVSVKLVPFFTHTQHQALTGISLGAGISFSNSTHQASAASDVASFTITSSSAISTGAKTNALYRVPYLCEFTSFDIKGNKTGGITLSARLSSDPGRPTTGENTVATLHASGLTASTTTFSTGGSIAGKFLHLNVVGNAAGATNAQAFLSFKPTKELAGD